MLLLTISMASLKVLPLEDGISALGRATRQAPRGRAQTARGLGAPKGLAADKAAGGATSEAEGEEMTTVSGPPFTVTRYGSLGACVTAERDWLAADNERLRAALGPISRMVTFPDAAMNMVTLSAAKDIARKALQESPDQLPADSQ